MADCGKKKKKQEGVGRKITGENNSGVRVEESEESPGAKNGERGERGDKPPLPRTPQTSAVTITVKEGSAQSYVEVLAAARDSIPLAEVGVKALKMRKAMTGGVVLELSEDQKGQKAAALTAQLTWILDRSNGGRDRHFGHQRRDKGHPGEGG